MKDGLTFIFANLFEYLYFHISIVTNTESNDDVQFVGYILISLGVLAFLSGIAIFVVAFFVGVWPLKPNTGNIYIYI